VRPASPPPFHQSNSNAAPPPLSVGANGPPRQGPSVLQVLSLGQERNHTADSMAHHPSIESLVKLGRESEATWMQIGELTTVILWGSESDGGLAGHSTAH
jgi:glucose repression mediator protein